MEPVGSARGLTSMVHESPQAFRLHAPDGVNSLVHLFWPEISTSVATMRVVVVTCGVSMVLCLEWLSRVTNWAKFSATTGLGVIHRGHLQPGRPLMAPTHLPTLKWYCWR
ncbi:hypothetical protein C4D60_Mb01t11300 [Musa balbisiana]|uniref:Uncharacterized protein n=1 Tax=Musa balbisiana TaxID=52838 RepID=A0A4S8JMS1_MUSBA|nr:hypothetical protein C4D60_Mb01t11300 [Musa balbisiana]